MVYSLLSILGTHNRDDMSRTLLAMSTSSDSCLAMRQSGWFQFTAVAYSVVGWLIMVWYGPVDLQPSNALGSTRL